MNDKTYRHTREACLLLALSAVALCAPALAASERPEAPADMSLEDLLKTEVTTASRKPQTLQSTAAAVFVITREDIERAGVTNIADALQMAPGVEVAHLSNNHWAVSVRGFNSRYANKLLVQIDGRSIYSPLFSGVIWELQDTLLEDIDRIEVIRGPGAAMWGANAVNGVINIITRKARETQGGLVVADAGTQRQGEAAFRYGGQAGAGHYRIWGKAASQGASEDASGRPGNDFYRDERLGFRGDWPSGSGNRLMVSGEAYSSPSGDQWNVPDVASQTGFTTTDIYQLGQGAHLLGRQDWAMGDGSEATLQAYFDTSDMKLADILHEHRRTFDIDFQHHWHASNRHDIVWGFGYRESIDHTDTRPDGMIRLTPVNGEFILFNASAHDEIVLLPETLSLTLGARLEHNNFTGWEPQPDVRLSWTPSADQTVWGAISHAVRTPSRAEMTGSFDLSVTPAVPPFQPAVLLRNDAPSSHHLDSEKVTAFELGYRTQITPKLSLDLAAFSNRYTQLRAASLSGLQLVMAPQPYVVQSIVPDNGLDAHTRGLEVALDWRPAPWWRLQPSYSYLLIQAEPTRNDPILATIVQASDGSSPKHQLSLRSLMSLPHRQQVDVWVRRVSGLHDVASPGDRVPGYITSDLRYAWRPTERWELSIVGRNLVQPRHQEIVDVNLPSQQILVERSFYLKAKWQF